MDRLKWCVNPVILFQPLVLLLFDMLKSRCNKNYVSIVHDLSRLSLDTHLSRLLVPNKLVP